MVEIKYRGKIQLGEIEFDCYVDANGDRFLSSRGMQRILKAAEDVHQFGGIRLPRYTEHPIIQSLMTEREQTILEPTDRYDGRTKIKAYYCESLPIFCSAMLEARRSNLINSTIHTRMFLIAEQCEIILSALSKVGIVALIDEATGFQPNRTKDALRLLLERYIIEEARKWMKEFDDSFFAGLDKLYNNEKTTPRNRPRYYGGFINKYIYEPLEHGEVLRELKALNPSDAKGNRKNRQHQHLTENFGLLQLRNQITKVSTIMEISPNLEKFETHFSRLTQPDMLAGWEED